ncbi:MAG TPA: AAA family ATPase, partial [Rhodocyclaceae bacterium]|nr:AAA family ATPase [Rhodocyclaceae bacterium]
MRLRYLHLRHYPPIKDMAVRFASGSPLQRECAIRFVVGVNGSGKSSLLRAVAEVFLALADERLPPFPVSLIYELGRRGRPDHYTFVVDCPGTRGEASLWVSEGFHWPDDTSAERFEDAINLMRSSPDHGPDGFTPLIRQGSWPQSAGIALPQAVLAYTTGDLRPWRSIWSQHHNASAFDSGTADDVYNPVSERPVGWTDAQEAMLKTDGQEEVTEPGQDEATAVSALPSALFRRPILLNPLLLKCALLAVALPAAFVATADYPERPEVDALMARFGGGAYSVSSLQALLGRGGWHYLVSVAFRCRLQTRAWNRVLREVAHDWLLCAGEVIAEPHPTESRRTLFFDLKGQFSGEDVPMLRPNDDLRISTTQGEALWSLLGGHDATAFERFARLAEWHLAGLFDDVDLRLRRQAKDDSDTSPSVQDQDVGVLRYEELSDGEQMLLGRMALFHLLQGQQDALLLLDEPETHFNDKWKREIIDII